MAKQIQAYKSIDGKIYSYVLQRCFFADEPQPKTGFMKLMTFDDMGYAEFEFGERKSSFDRILSNSADYTFMDIRVKSKLITIFCNTNIRPYIREFLNDLADGEIVTKTYDDFGNYVNTNSNFDNKTDSWWSFDCDFMFWKKNNEFELKFKEY